MKVFLEAMEVKKSAGRLDECIIVAGKIAGGMMFVKNRDRAYNPEVRIVHEVRDGVEIAYIEDLTTGWREGMNEYGIGVVNTALMVMDDEKEKTRIQNTGEKSKEGIKIVTALTQKTVEAAVKTVVDMRVLGHTFIGSPGELWAVEGTSHHVHKADKLSVAEGPVVRTNHGDEFEDAGYRNGDNRYSSLVRKASAERAAEDAIGVQDMMRLMRKKMYFQSSKAHLNMMRETPHMNTTSQMGMDLDSKILYFNALPGKVNFKGVDDMTPPGFRPRIRIVVTEIKSSNMS